MLNFEITDSNKSYKYGWGSFQYHIKTDIYLHETMVQIIAKNSNDELTFIIEETNPEIGFKGSIVSFNTTQFQNNLEFDFAYKGKGFRVYIARGNN